MLNFNLDKMKYLLRKESDNKFNGEHPNGIYAGREWVGHINKKPTIGEKFLLGTNLDHPRYYLLTSVVTKIISETKFETENSTYTLRKFKGNAE